MGSEGGNVGVWLNVGRCCLFLGWNEFNEQKQEPKSESG